MKTLLVKYENTESITYVNISKIVLVKCYDGTANIRIFFEQRNDSIKYKDVFEKVDCELAEQFCDSIAKYLASNHQEVIDLNKHLSFISAKFEKEKGKN